jgi:methylenetetrahydrofolate--tRNA-(uracil-5-)-methyltransferase
VRLRKEAKEGELYNLVGFQTYLKVGEQKRVLSLIPGLEQLDIVRYGVMHRNTFVDAPRVLNKDLSLKARPTVFLAGQICGTEGYLEAVASGLVCALMLYARLTGKPQPRALPKESVLGALLAYSLDPDVVNYQPMHVNYGLMSAFDKRIKNKQERYLAYSQRAQAALLEWLNQHESLFRKHG